MTGLKILVLCHEYPPSGGGGGVGAQQYAQAWAAKGHRVTVLTSGTGTTDVKKSTAGVTVIRVLTVGRQDRATYTFFSMFSYLIFAFLYVLSHIKEFRDYDIMNTHFAVPNGPLGLLLSRLLGIPNVLTIIGGDIYDPTKKSSPHRSKFMRLVNSVVMNSADKVVAISSDTKMRAEKYYKIRKPITVINYGFSIPHNNGTHGPSQFPLDHGHYDLISVGRLVKRKGFEFLISSLKGLPSNVRLLIVGDGPMENQLKNLARREKVNDRVFFLGYKPREQVYEYLKDADCFVLSSLHEGLGIVVQEAMYMGLPIVSTDNGGQVDLIKDSRNGLLVQPGDVNGLTCAIKKVFSDRTLARAFGRNNRKDIKKYYVSRNCQYYLALFEELAVGRSKDIVPVSRPATALPPPYAAVRSEVTRYGSKSLRRL